MIPTAYSLDTSFVIRLICKEPLPMFEQAAAFLRGRTADALPLIVSDLVLAESYFALQHHYGFSKADALDALLAFSRHPGIGVSPHASVVLQLRGIATTKPGFVDRLIHGTALSMGSTLATFEKSARNLPDTLVFE